MALIRGSGLPRSERSHSRRGQAAAAAATPEPAKKKKLNASNAWREARSLIAARRGRLALGLGLMLVNRLVGLVLPATSKFLIDDVIGKRQADLLMPLALAAGAATIVQAVTSFALSQVLGVAAQRAITDMRRRVEAHVARLPVRYFDSTQAGVLISRIMTDAEGIRNLVGSGLVQLVGSVVTALVALAILFYLNWWLTLATLTALAMFGGAMALAFNRLRPLFRERGKINAEVTGRLNETLGGIRIVKTYTAEKREELVFTKGVHRLFRNVAQSITGVSAITAFSTVVVGVIGVIMIVIGGRAILSGAMTLGDFIFYLVLTGLMAAPVVQIASIGTQISEAFAGLDRIRELVDMTTEDDEDDKKAPLGALAGEVIFEDVSFEYKAGVPVLKHVSFDGAGGHDDGAGRVERVGQEHADQPGDGVQPADGRPHPRRRPRPRRHPPARLPLADRRRAPGQLPLRRHRCGENISYGRPDATIEQMRAVSRIAHADEFIDGFEKGYDTVVGERGVRLSGGQRQRVAIARAILADPKILVLDEATSSLDSESEALIQDGLRSLRRGRTTFVIAHRLSTIRSADQILVLEHGEIVERGTHDELLALGGRYRTLYDKQYMLETDRFINPGEDFTTPAPAGVK